MNEQRPGLRQAVGALEYRDYRYFYISLFVGNIGTLVLQTASLWQVYVLTGSALQLGLTGLARAIPILTLSLVGGVVADRVHRLRFLVVMHVATGMLGFGLAVLTFGGWVDVWHIYAVTFLSSAFMALASPARTAVIPSLVPRDRLMNAIALNLTTYQVANIIGPAIAGPAVAIFGLTATYAGNGIAWVLSVVALLVVRAGPIPVRPRESAWRSLVEGLSFVRYRSIILVMLGMDSAATVLGSYRAMIPIFAVSLGWEADGTGLLLAAPGVGSVIGSAIILSLGDLRYKGYYVIGGILAYCASLVLLALSPSAGSFGLALVAMALAGGFDSVQMIPRNTAIQSLTPDALRGRVSAFQSMLTGGMPALGQMTSGALASAIGAPLALITGAIVCTGVILGITAARPDLRARDLGDPDALPVPAPPAAEMNAARP
jgi:MFS family permease